MPFPELRRPPRRVLLYRLGSLGDTLIALPSFHLVARAFPGAERRLLTSFPPTAKAPASSAILEHTGLVHGYFRYNHGTRSPRELLTLWWQLLTWRPEVVVYLSGARGLEAARRDSKFFRACGIRQQVGVPITEEMQRNLPAPERGPGMVESEAARLARNIRPLGDADLDDPGSWDLGLTSAERGRAAELLQPLGDRPFLAVSVGTKMQSKDWGRENWRQLLAATAAHFPHLGLVLCGAREESAASDFAAEGWRAHTGTPVVNLCGAVNPRESAAAIERSVLFVGHDSGPMHLAAAVGTPSVTIFASLRPPGMWFPHGARNRVLYRNVDCAGCGLETCIVQQKKCILSITVEDVLAEITAALASSTGPLSA